MFNSRGRHAAPRGRLVGPLFALEALMVTYAAKREMGEASGRQARDGAS